LFGIFLYLYYEQHKYQAMNFKKLMFILILASQNLVFAQSPDTINQYLKHTAIKLMNPHVDLNYSFTNKEIENKAPDLTVKIPQLKDTLKYIKQLKGNYSDWQTFIDIGNIYQRYGNANKAYSYFVNAYNVIDGEIKKDSLNAKYYSDMAELYLQLHNEQYAQAYLNLAYQYNPTDSMVLSILPTYLAQAGDFEKAEKINKLYLQAEPQNIAPYVSILTIEFFKVLSDTNILADIQDRDIDNLFDLKLIEEAQKKYKNKSFDVLIHVAKLLAIYVKTAIISDVSKGEINLPKEDKSKLKNIQKFFAKAASDKEYLNKHILYKSLGFINILQNNLDEALVQFNEMMKYLPTDQLSEDYDIIFATEFYLKKDTVNALKTLQEKIEHQKKMLLIAPADYIRLGNLYLQINKFSEAKKAYENALNLSNQAVEAYLGLSVIEMMNMNFQEANKYMNIAYEINRDNYLTYTLFGVLTLMANDYEQAKSALEQAMQLKPDSEDIKNLYQTFFGN